MTSPIITILSGTLPNLDTQTPIGDLLVSFAKDQDIMDEALPDALYYAGIYGLILLATTITVSVTIPLFSCLAGGLFFVSGIMLLLYLPAATHLKKLRMGAAGAFYYLNYTDAATPY